MAVAVIAVAAALVGTATVAAEAPKNIDQHWWTLARGMDFKTFDKCVAADGISPPRETYENAERVGLPAKLEDKGSEVDISIDFKTTSLSFRWFRTEAACTAAAQSNHGANASPDAQ